MKATFAVLHFDAIWPNAMHVTKSVNRSLILFRFSSKDISSCYDQFPLSYVIRRIRQWVQRRSLLKSALYLVFWWLTIIEAIVETLSLKNYSNQLLPRSNRRNNSKAQKLLTKSNSMETSLCEDETQNESKISKLHIKNILEISSFNLLV